VRRSLGTNGPFEATWVGLLSECCCRIHNVSQWGCSVTAMRAPMAGEVVTLRLLTESGPFILVGMPACIERPIGFTLRFFPLPPDESKRLLAWLDPSRTSP
jgi:hypothetical protein